jgi:small subunit ribosomal protein S20
MKTSNERRLRNRAYLTNLRSQLRDLRALTSRDEATVAYRDVVSLLDKAVTNGLIHKKNADRNKSRLARFVQHLG